MSVRDLLAIVILGVTADQADAELASGEISGTTAGEAWALVAALVAVAEAARYMVEETNIFEDPVRATEAKLPLAAGLAQLDAIRSAS